MVAHDNNFSRGVAMVLQGESLKASCYVTHAASLGVLREKMVGNFVRHETPERFRVETGLVRNHAMNRTSRQCDLLVHEPGLAAPLYRWEDFVIVHHSAARAVVEIKSEMEKSDFEHLLDVHASVMEIELLGGGAAFIPTFGYGLSGVTFDTFLGYIQDALASNRLGAADAQKHLNWPVCVAVQRRNYLGMRPLVGETGRPFAFCVVDLSKATEEWAKPVDGIETGFFLQIYTEILRLKRDALKDASLYEWFNKLPVADGGKASVTPDGNIHKGPVA